MAGIQIESNRTFYNNSNLLIRNPPLVKIEKTEYVENLEQDTPQSIVLQGSHFEANETGNQMDLSKPKNNYSEHYTSNDEFVKEFFKNSFYIKQRNYNKLKDEIKQEFEDSDEEDENMSSSGEDAKCNVCQKTFLDEDELNLHYSCRRLSEKKFACCNCKKNFRDNTQLKVHVRKHTGEKPYECHICEKKFTVNGNLSKHMRIHTGEKRFECMECGKKFTQFAHLEDHILTHTDERPYPCNVCHIAFKTKSRLHQHSRIHMDDNIPTTINSVRCPHCTLMFRTSRQLKGHLASHALQANSYYKCHLCDKEFPKYMHLVKHEKSHDAPRNYECHLCEKAFTNSYHLRRHIDTHAGIRPFICSVCSRPFPSVQNLRRHLMTHTGEKPFRCGTCMRAFLTLGNLNRHTRTHTGEKPFPCTYCSKRFAHSTTAKEHIRMVHTHETPFGCSLCQETFSISKLLYSHVREMHPQFFPQFKEECDLTPNVRKLKLRIKREAMCEADSFIPNVKIKMEKDEDTNNSLIVNPVIEVKKEECKAS